MSTITPFTQARLIRESSEKTLRYRLKRFWWTVQHAMFTELVRGKRYRYFSSMSQPKNNWPFAIWRRNTAKSIRSSVRWY